MKINQTTVLSTVVALAIFGWLKKNTAIGQHV